MSIRNIYSAESWSKVYQAFSQINFSAFDYETIKLSIIDYLRIYYPENFNDFIESSELVALIEAFAYIAEQMSYRLDMLSHETFITTAQRKQSILKLAKLISYAPSRNIPARGLVKITSISTSERVIDSNGTNLANSVIVWNDPNNANWKEQFFLIFNRVVTGKFGQFSSLQQVGDVSMQLYTFNHTTNSLSNGVFSFIADTGLESFPMELVPVLLDTNGPFEKTPDLNSQLSVVYAVDGLGDGSDYTGFLMYAKQGVLSRIEYNLTEAIPNRALNLAPQNVNDTDVWVTRVNDVGTIQEVWKQVEALADQNLSFNTQTDRKKFEVETLENDAVKLIFGDGDFSDIPVGKFYFWLRQSANRSIVIPPNKLANQSFSFQYSSTSGMVETASLTFALTSTIQNSSPSESIEHIRQSAPATYYSQNRMVNAQDYNTFMLKDQSILRLISINRTFAGQPKYIEWNDASGQYQNVKLFGDDLQLNYSMAINSINTGNTVSSRSLIDEVIEPLLSTTGVINTLNHISATSPLTSGVISLTRRVFLEDNRQLFWPTPSALARDKQLEKSMLQGAIDQHWYGDYVRTQIINDVTYAVIKDPGLHPEDDGRLWLDTMPRTIDGLTPYVPGDVGSGLQSSAAQQQFGLAFNRDVRMVGSDVSLACNILTRVKADAYNYAAEVFTFEVAANGQSLFVSSNLRGNLGVGEINKAFEISDIQVTVTQASTATYQLSPGDAFILRLSEVDIAGWTLPEAYATTTNAVDTSPVSLTLYATVTSINLLGRWMLINGNDLGTDPQPLSLPFDPTIPSDGSINPNSWLFWVKATINPVTSQPVSFTIYYRELKLIAYSANTKFWYNSNEQIIDPQTKNRVFDIVRILRSNTVINNGIERILSGNQNYDVVGPVIDNAGVINLHSLELMPTDMMNIDTSGNTLPDNILQFENFSDAVNNGDVTDNPYYTYFTYSFTVDPTTGVNTSFRRNNDVATLPGGVTFKEGSFISETAVGGIFYGRELKRTTLDFMWQHFTPYNNLIDPSVSNIHDTYILTQGYYEVVTSYIQGKSAFLPNPPTPLELRNQYSNLLQSKMLSDTVVLHPGKIKLLFGSMADPQLRAKFKVVKAITATMTEERIKAEILAVINSYFGIQNWDFGETFYATELFSLIHQRLPTEIASVVLVPIYAVNSFGSLFTVSSGLDEILQSAAQLSDIEIVAELNATVLRQS